MTQIRTDNKHVREVVLVCIITIVTIWFLSNLRSVAGIFGAIGALGIPLTFTYAPFLLAKIRKIPLKDLGLTLHGFLPSLGIGALTSLIVLPLFILGVWLFWDVLMGNSFALYFKPDFLFVASWNLVAIALPEEFFFRGYIQSRLNAIFPPRINILGARIGWAVVITSVIFAAFHLVTAPHVSRLAVFFPSLIFGWLRERTGSVAAPILFHWLANMTTACM